MSSAESARYRGRREEREAGDPADSSGLAPTEGGGADADGTGPLVSAADVDLVRRVLECSEDARNEFERRIQCVPRILGSRNRRLGSPLSSQELPDLVQDTLAVIWRKLPEFEGRASLETWMYQICSFELMNAIRRKRRAVRWEATDQAQGTLEWFPDRKQELPYPLRFEKLYRCLARLPRREERILRMKHYEDRTFEEIARAFGLSASGVKHHYYRALRLLREAMARGPGEGEP